MACPYIPMFFVGVYHGKPSPEQQTEPRFLKPVTLGLSRFLEQKIGTGSQPVPTRACIQFNRCSIENIEQFGQSRLAFAFAIPVAFVIIVIVVITAIASRIIAPRIPVFGARFGTNVALTIEPCRRLRRNWLRCLHPWRIGKFSFEITGDLQDFLEFASIQPDPFAFWTDIDLHTAFVDFDQARAISWTNDHHTDLLEKQGKEKRGKGKVSSKARGFTHAAPFC
jgi:hypothetical protein